MTRLDVAQVMFSVLPPMHLFPALPQPLRWYIGERARKFHRHLAVYVDGNEHCTLFDPKFTADISQMASDGFHPGPAIYAAWAAAAAKALLAFDEARAFTHRSESTMSALRQP